MMDNTPKPTSTVQNELKVSIGEAWQTIPTTWASETRTWQRASSLIENETRGATIISNDPRP